nr:MAG TPA: hypothetical protein [Caudoviricetes sp.]
MIETVSLSLGFHPLCIREFSKVCNSCIVSIKKEIKI